MKVSKVEGYRVEKDGKKRNIFGTFLSTTLWFLFFLFVLILGLSLIIDGTALIYDVDSITVDMAYMLAISVTALFYFFLAASKFLTTWSRILSTIAVLILSLIIVYYFGPVVLFIFKYVTGGLIILTGLLVLVNAWRKIRDRVNFLKPLLIGIIYIVIGVCSIVWDDGLYFQAFLIGIYLCLFACNALWQFFTAGTRIDRIRRVKKIITVPTVFSSFLTIGFFKQVAAQVKMNKLKKIGKKNSDILNQPQDERREFDEKPDMVIFIHIKKGILEGVGHVDFVFDDKVYCYGEYDEEAQYFGGLFRDGVLAIMDPREHVKRAVMDEEKLLIAYELKLTPRQKKRVRKKIEKIMSKAYRWRSKAELAANHLLPGKPMDYMDNASALYNLSKAETYKFSKGSDYKTYYVFGQNCSRVANDMITQIGIKLRKINGMITPGAYLNFMEELYRMPNSLISQRIFFRKDEIEIDENNGEIIE